VWRGDDLEHDEGENGEEDEGEVDADVVDAGEGYAEDVDEDDDGDDGEVSDNGLWKTVIFVIHLLRNTTKLGKIITQMERVAKTASQFPS